ncbi:MAG: 4,5-DOPA dioxygenase extradiol [Comamonas sp.]|nr:4,5-DOPA dioxygenase extradiol [Comamonas sp.]
MSLAGAGLAAVGGWTAYSMTSASSHVLPEQLLQQLKPSPRMPVMFIGHGSPMNVIEDTHWRQSWQALGQELTAKGIAPQLILCVSAHWLTESDWALTGMAEPRTIHDFGGFPQKLFDQQYPAPGAPEVAKQLAAELRSPFDNSALLVDHKWGFDHGTWSVLLPMFPDARIPVMQLSMPYGMAPDKHFEMGRQLRALRDRGVLIVGSGNVVHNLSAIRRDVQDNQAFDWCIQFDSEVQQRWASGNLADLSTFLNWGPQARMAHPTHDHYLPLLYAAGAVQDGEAPRVFNDAFQYASLSMRSAIWG